MDLTAINRARLVQPEGGSLNTTELTEDEFVKGYRGELPRGYEKLRLEYLYLSDLPTSVAAHFPHVNAYHYDAREPWAELRLRRIKHPALAKAILRGAVTPDRVSGLLSEILPFLTDDLYPLRGGELGGVDLYTRYHGDRMERSLSHLTTLPEIRSLVTASGMMVNGTPCFSAFETIKWLNANADRIFSGSHHLVAGHGDAHLDNMMVSTEGKREFFLIDPRGDRLLPPHYDLAKLLKAVRAGYDLVHYGGYQIDVRYEETIPVISLHVNRSVDDHYRAGMEALLQALPGFARAERISESAFLRVLLVAEIAHVISFASYHANRPEGRDLQRVTAYLAIAALLARDLIMEDPDPSRPLPIWSPKEE